MRHRDLLHSALEHLERMPGLERVDLPGTPLTWKAIKNFQRPHPNIKVQP
jgi:hypothetical protein